MWTACIQAKHQQEIIKVKTKGITKPFEPRHSDVCGPFSMPTSTGHCHHILSIDGYTRYTFVCVLRDMISKTCTSAYHTDIREKEKDSRCIVGQLPSHSHHSTSCGEEERVDIRCGSVERKDQKGKHLYPHNWVDWRENRHLSLW